MLRLPLFLLATSAAAIPSSYLRPLERDLRDMETAIEALNAKAARKGLRLEKTSKEPITVQVVHPDDESVFFYVKLKGGSTVDALKDAIMAAMKKPIWVPGEREGSGNWKVATSLYCTNYNKNKLSIGDKDKKKLGTAVILNDNQKVYLLKNCIENIGSGEKEKIAPSKWGPLKGKYGTKSAAYSIA